MKTVDSKMTLTSKWCWILVLTALTIQSAAGGLFGPSGDDSEEKKTNVRKQRDEMLADLYSSNPALKDTLAKAVGYATFKNVNVNLLLLSTANGYGMAVDNKSGKETFMRMASLGGGIGAGVKDVRVVFIFTDAKVMQQFIDSGWQFGGQADADAKYKSTGVSANENVKANVGSEGGAGTSSSAAAGTTKDDAGAARASSGTGMEIYQFTDKGLALQAVVSGTKYWKDSKLNE